MRKLLILTTAIGCIGLAGCGEKAAAPAEEAATEAAPAAAAPTEAAPAAEAAPAEGAPADESAPADAGESGGGNKI